MNKILLATACSLPIAFAAPGYCQTSPDAGHPRASQSTPSPEGRAGGPADRSATRDASNPSSSTTPRARDDDASRRKHQVEGADSGSTATASGGKSSARGNDKTSSKKRGGVVHPKEP